MPGKFSGDALQMPGVMTGLDREEQMQGDSSRAVSGQLQLNLARDSFAGLRRRAQLNRTG